MYHLRSLVGVLPAMHLSPLLQEALRPAASPAVFLARCSWLRRRRAFARSLRSRGKPLPLQPDT